MESANNAAGHDAHYAAMPSFSPENQSCIRIAHRRFGALGEDGVDHGTLRGLALLVEREEFLRQNTLMYRAWKAKAAVTPIVLEGLHHYSAVESLGDPNSELGLAIRQQMGL